MMLYSLLKHACEACEACKACEACETNGTKGDVNKWYLLVQELADAGFFTQLRSTCEEIILAGLVSLSNEPPNSESSVKADIVRRRLITVALMADTLHSWEAMRLRDAEETEAAGTASAPADF